jgi:YVTN family beta-propeller protein
VRAVSAALATRNRLGEVFGDALSLRIGVESGEVILGRPGSFVTGKPVAAAARLIRAAQPGEVVVGERAATASAGAFELQQRDGAYLLRAPLAPTRSPAQLARQRRRRRLLLLVCALAAVAAVAAVVTYATRETPITVPPNSVGIIDPKTNKVVGYVNVGNRPDAVAVGEGGVWVANEDDKTLSRVDPKDHNVQTIRLDATATGLAVGLEAVWVAHGYVGTVSRVDPQYYGIETIRPPFSRNAPAARGSIVIGDRSVWVAFGDASVSRIDPASRDVVATTYAGNGPTAIAYGLRSVWVANASDSSVTRINPATNDRYFGADGTVGLSPSDLAVRFGAVWVTDKGQDAVSRIDPGTGSVKELPAGGRVPTGIAAGFGSLWVANSGDGTVSRIDPHTRKVVATINVGNSPWRIAVGEGKVWVTVQAPVPAT